MSRGQSHVVGVALMLGLTVAALGALTLGVGTLLDAQAATADTERVADGFDRSIRPQQTTGVRTGAVRFTSGRLRTADRQVELRRNGRTVERVDADALVFENGDRRVAFLGGAIVRGTGGNTWFVRDPPISAARSGSALVVSVASLGAGDTAIGGGGGTVRLVTDVSHDRRAHVSGQYSVAIETAVPGAYEDYFAARNVTTTRRDLDGDGLSSVVASYAGERRVFLVSHDLALEVGSG